MKTEKELKDELEDIFFDALTDKSNPPYYTDKVDPENDGRWQYKVYELCADELIKRGYGDVSEYKAEIERLKDENYKLTEKLAKQTRIARDANAKFTGVEHYLKPFQYKADRLQTKCDDLKKLSDWQREEIKRLKAEVNKGCDNCETIKQGQVDVLKELKKRIYDISPYNPLISKDNVKYSIDKLINEIENDK